MLKNRNPIYIRPSSPSGNFSEHAAQLDTESLPLRRLLCAFIEQAAEDLHLHAGYKCPQVNSEMREAKHTAKLFFRSRAFIGICGLLHLSPQKIRDGAATLHRI